jgi:hypothetical protein
LVRKQSYAVAGAVMVDARHMAISIGPFISFQISNPNISTNKKISNPKLAILDK